MQTSWHQLVEKDQFKTFQVINRVFEDVGFVLLARQQDKVSTMKNCWHQLAEKGQFKMFQVFNQVVSTATAATSGNVANEVSTSTATTSGNMATATDAASIELDAFIKKVLSEDTRMSMSDAL